MGIFKAAQANVISLGPEPPSLVRKGDDVLFKGVEETRVEIFIPPQHFFPYLGERGREKSEY